MAESFDPYYLWLGIPLAEQPPHHYRLLAVQVFEANLNVIEAAADQRMAHLRTYQASRYSDFSQRLLNEVAAAKICLLNPAKKAAYDAKLRAQLAARMAPPQPESEGDSFDRRLAGTIDETQAAHSPAVARKHRPLALIAAVGLFAVAVLFAILYIRQTASRPQVAAVSTERLLAEPTVSPVVVPVPDRPTVSRSNPVVAGSPDHATATTADLPARHPEENGRAADRPSAGSGDPRRTSGDPRRTSGDSRRTSEDSRETSPREQKRLPNGEPIGPVPSPARGEASSRTPSQSIPGSPRGTQTGASPKHPAAASGSAKPVAAESATLAPPAPHVKYPIPSDEAQQAMLQQLEEAYKISAAQTAQQKLPLARDFEALADKPGAKPDERYVLCITASRLAGEAGDVREMLHALNGLRLDYQIEILVPKTQGLVAMADRATDAARIKSVINAASGTLQRSVVGNKYDLAENLLMALSRACQRPAGKEFRKTVRDRRTEIEWLKKQWLDVQQPAAQLKAAPDDAEANLAMGRWHCLVRGEWDQGLPFLAKGSDERLRQLAEQELKSAVAKPGDQVKLADAWWELAQRATGKTRDGMLLRAGYWYAQIDLPAVSTLAAAKIEKRLEVTAKIEPSLFKMAAEAITNSIGMQFTLIPAGEFAMGSSPKEVSDLVALTNAKVANPGTRAWWMERIDGQQPQHHVRITRSFYLGVYHVTQADYQKVMGVNPSRFSPGGQAADRVAGVDTSRFPVEMVSWTDAVEFCRRLSAMSAERGARRTYRLPTEAESEYACRGGTATRCYFGDDPALVGDFAWCAENAQRRPHPVGEKKPNPWGLYDMVGNVNQWCADWFNKDYYRHSPVSDPTGPPRADYRVTRGLSFADDALRMGAAAHLADDPIAKGPTIGFRVVCVMPGM